MASYMSSVIDVLVTDVLEYLGGPVPTTASSSPSSDTTKGPPVYHIPQAVETPAKHKQNMAATYSHLTGYAAVTVAVVILLMIILCRRCHRRKRARVAFAGLPSHSQNMGMSSCRRIHISSLTVQAKYKPIESGLIANRYCTGDHETYKTEEQQSNVMMSSTLSSANNGPVPREPKQDSNSCKVKEGVKRKFEEGAGPMTVTVRKASQCACLTSQKLPRELPKRQLQHAYTYASPNRKVAEVVKSAITNTTSCQSDAVKSRWKGSIQRSKLNKMRLRYEREMLQPSLKRNSTQARDFHLRRQQNMNHRATAVLHTSSNSSPFCKPVYPRSTQCPQQLSRHAHSRSSPEKRKQVKRSKTLMSGVDDSSVVINSKVEFQKGRDNYKRNPDWSTVSKTKETLATYHNQKSPKKIKKSSVLLKGKKISGQRKTKKVRKRHKFKEKNKSVTLAIEKVTFPEKRAQDNYCHYPEPFRDLHVPAVVRQVTTKGTRAESFTIKRTATPVLSSLLGQGAFRTCWPQSGDSKSVVHSQELDGHGNTGRHNANFLGPKLAGCINETSETTNYSQTKHKIFWKRCKREFNSHKSCDSTADTTTHTGLVLSERVNPHDNSCVHISDFQISEQPLEAQECRNIFNVVNNTEANTVCQNLRLGETRMNNGMTNIDNQRNEQLCASTHAEKLKQQTECLNSSNKLMFASANPPDDNNEKGGMPAKIKTQLQRVRNKGHGQTGLRCEWNVPCECPHLSSNRNSCEMRIPEAWAHGDKPIQISNQPKDNDVRTHREALGKRYVNHDTQWSQQCPCTSLLTCHPENRQGLSNTDTILCETQHVNNVQQHAKSIQQSDAKPCFYNTDKSQTAALSQCSEHVIPVDFKEFRNLWETQVTQEGNVFTLTRNYMLPSRLPHDNTGRLKESTNSHSRQADTQNSYEIWQDPESNGLPVGCRSEGKKGWSSRAVGLCKDVSHKCSKQLDNIYAKCRNSQPNEETQDVSRVSRIKNEHKCLEYQQTGSFDARFAHKLIPRLGIAPKVHDSRNTLANSSACPPAEECADFGIRVYDRLNQSHSSASSPVDEASGADSDSPAERQHEVAGKPTQAKQIANAHCIQNQVNEQAQEDARPCECRNHAVTVHGRDENQAAVHGSRRHVKCQKREPPERPTGKQSVFHGHVVKRNKSLISVRNMLNELTSHLRTNHGDNHPTATTHVREPRGKTLFYFKPTHMLLKDPPSPKEHDISSAQKSMHCHVLECSNTTEASGNNEGTGQYVNCYRPRKYKAYRHEPYRKRAPTSSESTVTPSSGYYWTKNKNNCSPSRKGRYVLGPLVDKHVFPEEQHNSDVGTVEDSGFNSVVRREDNMETVSGGVRHSSRIPVNVALDTNNVKHQETDHSDVEEETKECENVVFPTTAFAKTRRIPADSTDKDHVDFWNHGTSGQQPMRHVSAWPAAKTQPANDDSQAAHTSRISRRHTDAGFTRPAETRYKIIRQYCAGCPEASHTIKRHVSTGYATKEETIARHITKIGTAKRNVCKRNTHIECLDKGSTHTDHTCGRHKDKLHTTRHDNPVDSITETNEPVEDTNKARTDAEDATTRRRHTGKTLLPQNILKQEVGNKYVKDTAQQQAAKKPTTTAWPSVKKVSEANTEADYSLVRSTTNKQTTAQNIDAGGEYTDQHSTARDQDMKRITVFCSENDLKSTVSLKTDEKIDLLNERRSDQFNLHTQKTTNASLIKAHTEPVINKLTTNDHDKSLFLSTAETSESKPKATSRIGCSRYQYNRLNAMKKQICLARLKASRGPLSMRYPASCERNLKSLKTGSVSVRPPRLQCKSHQTPATQSHTTQTENSINSAHVAVQTSPGLQVTARRTPLHSKTRRYLVNPKLFRDKTTQKECLLSRHRTFRKPPMNAPDSLSASASQPVQLSTQARSINRNPGLQNETVLENRFGTSDNQNITTVQAVTEKPSEQSTVIIRGHTGVSDGHTHTSFDDHSRHDQASHSQELQDTRWNEKREICVNFGTEKEVADKKESLKQDAETATDRRRWDDKRKERTFILEFSNTQFSGTQDKGSHDAKPLHPDNKETETCTADNISCQTSRPVQTAEVSGVTQLSTAGATTRSNRISAVPSSDSSALSSRLSELNRFCIIRPIWKNANIEEIDRRVMRSLKLREELKQSASTGSRARSLIASYFEASAAENTGKSSDGMRSGASSTFASDFESANRSAYLKSRDERTPFQDTGSDDTICQNGDHIPITEGRSSSVEEDRRQQGDAVPGSGVIEAAQIGMSLRRAHRGVDSTNAVGHQTQENTVCEQEQRHGRHAKAEYALSFHEDTASESASRVGRPSSAVASHRPSNSNSGNSVKRAAMKTKNSPPTKISKVENICTSTPRLVGALVQTLPQVPLTSFVEWFIETSDPNNFLPSDRPSSSSDNSPGDSAHCGFDESTPIDDNGSSKVWQTILFNEPHERDAFGGKNKESRPVSIAAHRKALLPDNPTCKQPEEHVPSFDGTKPKCFTGNCLPVSRKSNMPNSLSSAFPSTPSSATYGMSTLSGDTEEQSDLMRNTDTDNRRQRSFLEAVKEANITNYPLKPKGDEISRGDIMKELCTKFASKRINENSVSLSNVTSKHRQAEISNTSRHLSTSTNQQYNVPTEELTRTDSFSENSIFQPADSCTYSHPISKAHLQFLPQTTDDTSSGQITHSESTEESAYFCKSKHDKTDRVDSGVAKHQDGLTETRITRKREENPGKQPSVDSACTSEQGDVTDRQLIRDVDEDNRCAPGIRHILMKLRQTADVDDCPVPRAERTKITLRKCSDVTGIIARFQNTQP